LFVICRESGGNTVIMLTSDELKDKLKEIESRIEALRGYL
jgi:hypothetical protein